MMSWNANSNPIWTSDSPLSATTLKRSRKPSWSLARTKNWTALKPKELASNRLVGQATSNARCEVCHATCQRRRLRLRWRHLDGHCDRLNSTAALEQWPKYRDQFSGEIARNDSMPWSTQEITMRMSLLMSILKKLAPGQVFVEKEKTK